MEKVQMIITHKIITIMTIIISSMDITMSLCKLLKIYSLEWPLAIILLTVIVFITKM